MPCENGWSWGRGWSAADSAPDETRIDVAAKPVAHLDVIPQRHVTQDGQVRARRDPADDVGLETRAGSYVGCDGQNTAWLGSTIQARWIALNEAGQDPALDTGCRSDVAEL